jgi:hypothetical protein
MQNVKQLLICLCLVSSLFGCVIANDHKKEPRLQIWYPKHEFCGGPYTITGLRSGDDKLVARFTEMYRLDYYISEAVKKYGPFFGDVPKFNELAFDRVILTSASETTDRLFIFDIKRLRDVQAAFKVDSDNKLIDNFIISSF